VQELGAIHNQRLFFPVDLDSSPYAVAVRPARARADMTSFYGSYSGLLPALAAGEGGGAGRYNTTLILRDEFGNARQAACLALTPSSDASSPSSLSTTKCEDAARFSISSQTSGRRVLPALAPASASQQSASGLVAGWRAPALPGAATADGGVAGYRADGWNAVPHWLFTTARLSLEVA